MSRLAELQRHIQETGVAIARAERALASHPEFLSTEATLRGYLKMHENLETQFRAEAAAFELDVCSYRIVPEGDRPTVSGLTAVLSEFQRLFTTAYDVVINGPKQVAKAGDAIERATSLGLAYTFPGSFGVMMTLENKRRLFGDSEMRLDDAMHGVFELMSITNPGEALMASRKYGVAALRVAHQWAKASADAQFGADIAWLRADQAKGRINLQRPEVVRLESAIRHTTKESTEDLPGGPRQ